MTKNEERRTLQRIDMPGVVVRYKIPKGIRALKYYANAGEALNVSKSGIAFHIDESVSFGTPVQIKVSFPDGQHLDLKGNIRWQQPGNSDSKQMTGVQFYAFGRKGHYNPPQALEYLRSMKGQAIEFHTDEKPPQQD